MLEDKLEGIFRLYMTKLDSSGFKPKNSEPRLPPNVPPSDRTATKELEHIYWMCDECLSFIVQGRHKKAILWLGFIQGVLWSHGVYTIDELIQHVS